MAKGLTDDSHYQGIAEAIRNKKGSSDTYRPEEMAAAIDGIAAGDLLDDLSVPAGAPQILSGYQAYDSDGNPITGTGELFESQAVFTLEASKWNGTTYTVSTTAWKTSDTATPLMDLPYNSTSVNAQRVVEAGITMPSCATGGSTTTIVFSAVTTPTVDVDVAVFNLVEVVSE